MITMPKEEEGITYYNTMEAINFLKERGVRDIARWSLIRAANSDRIEARKTPKSMPGTKVKQYWYEFAEPELLKFVERWKEENG